MHAYRDAARLGRQALDLWPEGERGAERIAALERHARYAELAGDLGEAARAQREVVAARRAEGAGRALADAERRIAGDLRAAGRPRRARWPPAGSPPRPTPPTACPARRPPSGSSIAGYLQSAGHARRGERDGRAAGAREAVRAERDRPARARDGARGRRARQGRRLRGRASRSIRAGLSLALEHELTAEAAEVYQRLGTAHEIAGDYGGAREALGTALGLCERTGAAASSRSA